MAERVAAHDWAATPLGAIGEWPQSLRTAVDIALASGHAMQLAWGPERVVIYNDAYAPMLGARHPAALGAPLARAWPEIRDEIAPLVERVFAGETVDRENMPLTVMRNGRAESTAWSFSYSPVRDETGEVAGLLNVAREITGLARAERERDEADARLRRNEARFHALVTAGGNSIYRMSADWRYMYELDSATLEVTAAPLEGWAEKYILEEDRPRIFAAIARAVETKSLFEAEHRVRLADGGVGWVLSRAVPLLTPEGEIFEWFGAGGDVTERKRVEEALRKSEERLRQFGEASQDVLWIRDAERLQWRYLTPAFEAIYGMARADALRGDNYRGWLDVVVPEDRERVRGNIERVRAGERTVFDYRVKRPLDGAIRWMRDTSFPIADRRGRVALIGGIGHDLTELREAEDRMNTLVRGMPQLVWRAVDRGRWTWASTQWEAFTGLSSSASADFGWLDALHPDDRARALDAWSRAVERGGFEVEYRLLHAGENAYRWFQTRATPVRDGAGAIVKWLGTSTDIDDLRALQERQRVLVAELQHRTRNVMGVVQSIAGRTGETSVDFAEFRAKFHDRLEALARVHGLLSRLEETDRVAFDEVLRVELAAMNGASDRVELEGESGVKLRSGTVQVVAMALHELATNAVKYGALCQPGARLRVSWRMVAPDRRGRPRLRVEWRESGVRMPPAGAAPQGGGQGRELIERALPCQLDAETSFELGPEGVRCVMTIPVSAENPAPGP